MFYLLFHHTNIANNNDLASYMNMIESNGKMLKVNIDIIIKMKHIIDYQRRRITIGMLNYLYLRLYFSFLQEGRYRHLSISKAFRHHYDVVWYGAARRTAAMMH